MRSVFGRPLYSSVSDHPALSSVPPFFYICILYLTCLRGVKLRNALLVYNNVLLSGYSRL